MTDKIFEPFFTTKPEGMGMGLALSRTIIEAHGGALWLDRTTTQSGGAVFRFNLLQA
jgi:signal transduction histidine kinase